MGFWDRLKFEASPITNLFSEGLTHPMSPNALMVQAPGQFVENMVANHEPGQPWFGNETNESMGPRPVYDAQGNRTGMKNWTTQEMYGAPTPSSTSQEAIRLRLQANPDVKPSYPPSQGPSPAVQSRPQPPTTTAGAARAPGNAGTSSAGGAGTPAGRPMVPTSAFFGEEQFPTPGRRQAAPGAPAAPGAGAQAGTSAGPSTTSGDQPLDSPSPSLDFQYAAQNSGWFTPAQRAEMGGSLYDSWKSGPAEAPNANRRRRLQNAMQTLSGIWATGNHRDSRVARDTHKAVASVVPSFPETAVSLLRVAQNYT